MEEIRLKKSKIKVIDEAGKEYLLRRPTIKEAQEMDDKIKGDEANGTQALIDLLAECGLPSQVTSGLTTEEVEAIVGALMPKKKA